MLTRRQMLATTSTFAGYAIAVDKVLAQAIKTDTDGIVAGDQVVKIGTYEMRCTRRARDREGPRDRAGPLRDLGCPRVHPRLHPAVRQGRYYAVAPELFKREGGVAQIPNVQDILKIVLARSVSRPWATASGGGLGQDAAQREGDQRGRHRLVLGRIDRISGGGHEPGHEGRGRLVRAACASVSGCRGPGDRFDLAKDIKAPFLGLYGETDQNPKPEDARRFGELVKQHNPNVEVVVYPGAGHGFYADYRPSYNAAAATDAWKRCTDFFAKNLRA